MCNKSSLCVCEPFVIHPLLPCPDFIMPACVVLPSMHVLPLQRHYLGLSKHARWRYILSTDGHTASSRLGKILPFNSVVMKEKSPWIEYYYRSLENGKHYLEFEPTDLLSLLQKLNVGGSIRNVGGSMRSVGGSIRNVGGSMRYVGVEV